MHHRLCFGSLFFCLFLLDSCKQSRVKIPISKDTWDNIREKDALFSPVTHIEAKKIIYIQEDKNKKNLLTNHQLRNLRDTVRQKEAKLSDVPILIDAEPIETCYGSAPPKNNTIILGYRSTMALEDIRMFYMQEMDHWGWKNVAMFDGFETLLNFQKPNKFCSISIRSCSCDFQKPQEHNIIILFVTHA